MRLQRMTKIAIIVTLMVSLTVSYAVHVLHGREVEGSYSAAAIPLVGLTIILVLAAATVLAFRATMVAWITLLVLLTFTGNRRKVLAQRGRRIALEVAWILVSVLFRSRKSLFALVCATAVSLLATYR